MRKLILICIICIIPCFSAIADTMVVKVPVLNVRKCPSTDCNIINKLSKGDKVNVSDINSGWAKIETDNDKAGYAISRSLRKSYSYMWWYVIGAIVIYILILHTWNSYINKCPKCGKWNALNEIDRVCTDKIKSNIKKVATTHYKDHTRRREYIVPATVYKYRVTKKCTNCGHTVISTETEKVEN